ncbi:phage regulatory protein/antirepressor Ant [Hyphomicrobium sp.]|uniref:phage regulatory protein/antirepressor Ant n=1 Tax=Hyphomicrobium sp. TaxID=82 RepID=UPI002FE2EF49
MVDRNPVVFAKDGAVFTSSRDVADAFEKNHRDVLRAIRNLIDAEPSLELRNFAPFKINDLTGESTSHYEMDRDGFTLLAMGFTGSKALQWKLRYIEAFNRMEAELRSRPAALPDLSDPVVLVQLLTEHATKRIEAEQRATSAEAKASELAPKAEAFDILDASEGSVNVRVAAKMLESPERKFIGWLQANSWAYRQNGIGPLQAYVDKRNAGYLEHRAHTFYDQTRGEHRTVVQMMITPKGLARLAQIFAKQGVPA